MRANWKGNTVLQGLTRVADRLGAAYAFPELLRATRDATKQTKGAWDAADSLTGLDTATDPGGVRLVATVGTQLEEPGPQTEYATALDDRDSQFDVAKIVWLGDETAELEIVDVRCYLDPVRDGVPGNKEVAYWDLWLYVSELAVAEGVVQQPLYKLVPLANPKRVAATGTVPADFTFDFTNDPARPKPKSLTAMGRTAPTLYLVVRPVKADGITKAGNVGWGRDAGTPSVTDASGNVLSGARLSRVGLEPGFYHESGLNTPVCRIRTPTSYAAATIAFTDEPPDPQNVLNLGAVPTSNVEFSVHGDRPGGSTITAEVRNDADSAWVPFTDGMITADSDGPAAMQIAGVTKRATYKVRAALAPGAGNRTTPTLRRLAVREITSYLFNDQVRMETSGSSVDPIAYKAEIEDLRIAITRNGERDYRDPITELLINTDLEDLEVRLWWGHADTSICPRANWMLRGSYLVRDWKSKGATVTLYCHSPLAHLRQALPIYATATDTRDALEYPGATVFDTPKEVWEDLIDGQLAVPGRYRGQGPTDQSTTIRKTIDDSDAKVEADAVAALDAAGRINIDLQGRLTAMDFYSSRAVEAIIPADHIRWEPVGPGYAERIPAYYVRFGYNRPSDSWEGETRQFDTDGVNKLGRAPFAEERLADEIAKWIPTTSGSGTTASPYRSTLADAIADRMSTRFGLGARFLAFRTTYPYPELHLGSVVACAIDELIIRNVKSPDQVIRGPLWVIGTIVADDTVDGTGFSIWVQHLSDIVGTQENATLRGYLVPQVRDIAISLTEGGAQSVLVTCRDAKSVRLAAGTSAPSEATVLAAALQALDANGQYQSGTLQSLTGVQVGYVAAIAFEKADGTGARSVYQVVRFSNGIRRYLDSGGLMVRAETWNDGKTTLKASDAVGKETDDDLFVSSTKTVKVGTVASPGSLSKELRTNAASFQPKADNTTWNVNDPAGGESASLDPNGSGSPTSYFFAFLVIPPGVTLTLAALQADAFQGSSLVEAKLYRNSTVLATLTRNASGGGFGEVTSVISQLVGTEVYCWRLQLTRDDSGLPTNPGNAVCSYTRVEYTMPSYDKGV